MKLLIIGANGGVGSHVTKYALDRGHEVDALINMDKPVDPRATIIRDNAFNLTSEDIRKYDAVISCFASGFGGDPALNKMICEHYVSIFKGEKTRLLHIVGSGCLYQDETRTLRNYQRPDHPSFLVDISRYATDGLNILMNSVSVNWTVVIPSITFENTETGSGKYKVGTDLIAQVNEEGKSYSRYYDLAHAMVDFVEKGQYNKQAVTILSQD